MSPSLEQTTRKRRTIANTSICVVAMLLVLITRHVESLVTIILPSAVVHWIISRERRFAAEDPELPSVPWPTRAALFRLLPALSLAVIAFWFNVYGKNWNPWGLYAVASFSLALLLVKIYERFLLIRKRTKEALQQITESETTTGLTDRSPAKRLAASRSQSLRFRAREGIRKANS